jgi:hypothetical protein
LLGGKTLFRADCSDLPMLRWNLLGRSDLLVSDVVRMDMGAR